MQHSSMYPSLEEGRLSRQEQQCCQGFDFVAWQLYFDRSESSPADQGFATNQGCLAAVQFLSSTAGYSIFNPTSIFSWNIANCLELSLHLLGFGHSGVFPTHHGLGPTPKECQHCSWWFTASRHTLEWKRHIRFTAIGMGRTCNQGAVSSLPLWGYAGPKQRHWDFAGCWSAAIEGSLVIGWSLCQMWLLLPNFSKHFDVWKAHRQTNKVFRGDWYTTTY